MKIDLVIPADNEREFIKTAEKLRYGGICFLYSTSENSDYYKKQSLLQKKTKLRVFFGKIIFSENVKKTSGHLDLLVIKSSSDDRNTFERGKADVIYDLETKPRKDFIHHRNSGLNQVLCKLAKKNKMVVGFSFSSLLISKDCLRFNLFGRLKQNISLCRKYKIKTLIASFARKPHHMRSYTDLISLGVSLGMHPKEAQNSLEEAYERILLNKKKKRKEFIHEGVEIIT